MKELSIGLKATASLTVNSENLAVNVGSGSLEVFATPMMVMLMEKASCQCIKNYLENDETSVGTEIAVQHISATPAGMNVTAEAEITEINGREITFNVTASDESGLIGKGSHKRFIVYGEKFTAKTQAKLK